MNRKVIRKEIRRENEQNEWCAMQVELTDIDGFIRLSICGSAGYILTEEQAAKESFEFWVSHFSEGAEGEAHAKDLLKRFKIRRKRGEDYAEAAARVVQNIDGLYHGSA